jgi:hypothetical protein
VLKVKIEKYIPDAIKTAVICRPDSTVKSNNVSTYTVDFQIQTLGSSSLANLQSIKLSIDLSVFDLTRWDGTGIDLSSLTATLQRLPDNTFSALSGWTGSIWAAKSTDGNRLLLLVEPSRGIDPLDHPNGYSFNELTTLQSFRLSYKPGMSVNNVDESVIRLMDESELLSTLQSEKLLLSDGTETYSYGNLGSAEDTLPPPEFIFFYGVSVNGKISTYHPGNPATIRLLQDDRSKYEITVPGFGSIEHGEQQEQEFIIENVLPGIYTLEITKTAHTKYIVKNVVVSDSGLDLTEDPRPGARLMELLVGDVNGDGSINANDINLIWSTYNYNKSIGQARDKVTDLNGDGLINANDLNLAWSAKNYGKGTVVIDSAQYA